MTKLFLLMTAFLILASLPMACGKNLSSPTAPAATPTATVGVTPNPTDTGLIWHQVTASAAPARNYAAAVSFSSQLWLIGGKQSSSTSSSDVWSSTNGQSWTQAATGQFAARNSLTALAYNGQLWVIGGVDSAYLNDVWSSSNGSSWTNVLTDTGSPGSSQFAERYGLGSAVFNNKMWVIGGTGSASYYDVWYSTDGVTWTQASSGQFTAGFGLSVLVYNNLLWVIGGNTNGVWSSPDGVTWTSVLADTSSPGANQFIQRKFASAFVENNLMWIVGGLSGVNTVDTDVWYSSNGATWTEANTAGAFGSRAGAAGAVFNNEMFLMGGLSNPACAIGCLLNDVWESP